MSDDASPWLPQDALGDAALERAILHLARGWSERWLGTGSELAVESAAPGDELCREAWIDRGSWSVCQEGAAVEEIGRSLTGLKQMPRTRRDRSLLARAGLAATQALAEHLEASTCGNRADLCEALPSGDVAHGKVQSHRYRLSSRRDGWSLLLAGRRTAMVAARRMVAGTAISPAPSTLSAALNSQRVSLGCFLGASLITTGELASLAPGDILVLDRAIKDTLPMTVDRCVLRQGRVRVEPDGDQFALCITETVDTDFGGRISTNGSRTS